MSYRSTDPNAVWSPIFLPCPPKELRNFKDLSTWLTNKYGKYNDRNIQLASRMLEEGWEDAALKLERCHATMTGNHLSKLKPAYYCKQTLLCGHCANVKAAYRQQQLQASLTTFAEKVTATNIRAHKIIIRPNTSEIFDNPQGNLKLAVAMLKQFKKTLNDYHNDHNSTEFVRRTQISRKSCRELKQSTLGPTLGAFHIVPLKEDNQQAEYAHFHLTIHTEIRTGQKYIHELVTKLWEKTTQAYSGYYDFSPSDVIRPSGRAKDAGGWAIRSNTFSANFDEDETKFSEDQSNAMKHARYLARPLKPTWNADTVISHIKLLDQLNLVTKDLFQFLGKEDETVKRLPCAFPTRELGHKYTATYEHDGSWSFSKRCDSAEEASSAGKRAEIEN